MQAVLSFAENQRGEIRTSEVAPQLTAGGGKPGQGYPAVLSFKPSHYTRGKDGAPSDVWPPLSADADKGDQEALAFHHTQDPISGDVSPAIGRTTDGMGVVVGRMVAFGEYNVDGTASAIKARDYKDATDLVVHDVVARPRRLLPIETERLMGWPDHWTATGAREDGTTYQLSDSARYRLCGNGVGAPVAAWIGRQLMEVHGRLPPH